MFIVFIGALLFAEPPLTSTQMLWVNLIMDTFAALALATEPPADDVLDRKPSKKTDVIVNAVMWRNIIGQSIYQMIVLLVLLYRGKYMFNIDYENSDPFYPTEDDVLANPDKGWVEQEPTAKVEMYTIIFQVFVFMQLFNQINSRKLGEREFNVFSNFFNNWMFLFILIATFAIQMVIVEFGDRYMRAVPLTWAQNGWCALIAGFTLPWGVALKFVPSAWFTWLKLEETPMTEIEEQESLVSSLRRSHTIMQKSNDSLRKAQTKKIDDVDEDGYKINN